MAQLQSLYEQGIVRFQFNLSKGENKRQPYAGVSGMMVNGKWRDALCIRPPLLILSMRTCSWSLNL